MLGESIGNKENKRIISTMLREHRAYVKGKDEIKRKRGIMFTKSLSFFSLLSDYFPFLVEPYLLARRSITPSDGG